MLMVNQIVTFPAASADSIMWTAHFSEPFSSNKLQYDFSPSGFNFSSNSR